MGSNARLLTVSREAAAERYVVVCGLDPQQRARITDAVRGRAGIRALETFAELRRVLRTQLGPVDCVVIPYQDPTGVDAVATVRQIVAERPELAIVAYCRAGSQYSADLRALAGAGVHQFVFAGIDDHGIALRAVLDAAHRQCAAESVMRALASIVPPTLHSMLEAALAKPDEVTTVAALARVLGIARGTIFNRCRQAWGIRPEELLIWARLALAAHFLEYTGCTVEAIAYQLGFASDNALRNSMKRYSGLRATEVRAAGGVRCLGRALRKRVARVLNAPE